MIKEIIETIVGKMVSNGRPYSFLHAEKSWQNLVNDEQRSQDQDKDGEGFQAVYLDMPIKFNTQILTGGHFERQYVLVVLFLFKGDMDNSPDQQYAIELKAEKAQREFVLRMDQEKDLIKSFTVGQCVQVPIEFDGISTGIIMPFTVTPRNFKSVCLNNT